MEVRSVADCSANNAGIPDAELLERFVSRRDEAAFAALMLRHGPMVFGVCRRMLRHAQDAEDAFQATFLVLVRKAADIGKRELLSHWLYGVAARVAARARVAATRRQTRETADMEKITEAARPPTESPELSEAIEEEVQRLPAKYRRPVVLCYLEGHTNEEAAGELRWPVGTVKGRLARARALLHKRLTRRGLALSTGALTTVLSPEALASSLIDSTLKAATSVAAGNAAGGGFVSAQAVALTKGVLHTMFVAKMKTLAVLLLVLTIITGGTAVLAYHVLMTAADKKEKPKSDQETIQGTWEVVSLTADKGVDVQEAMLLRNAAWIFEKDKFLIKGQIAMRVDVTVEGPYKLDPAKTPRTIDMTMKSPGGDKEAMIEGIYKLRDDNLTVCIPQGQDKPRRPTEFKAEEGSKQCLLVFKRKK